MKKPVNVAITGAAGQIGYALAFRVASGQMLGADQPVNLMLLEITPALGSLAARQQLIQGDRHQIRRLGDPPADIHHSNWAGSTPGAPPALMTIFATRSRAASSLASQ